MTMITALLMGLAGSLHCAGMCSPLAMAITSHKPFLLNKVIYNTGRVLVYGIGGMVAASLGSMIMITSYQAVVSFAVGAVFLLLGIGAITGVPIPFFSKAVNRFTNWIRSRFQFWLQRKNAVAQLVMGMLNGLMPCGLTYLALTYCFILPSAIDGFWFMMAFGLGTWPVMIGFTWLLGIGWNKLRFNYQRATTIVFISIGLWLMVRVMMQHPVGHSHLTIQNPAEEIVCP
jgi:uncharacterized protein